MLCGQSERAEQRYVLVRRYAVYGFFAERRNYILLSIFVIFVRYYGRAGFVDRTVRSHRPAYIHRRLRRGVYAFAEGFEAYAEAVRFF